MNLNYFVELKKLNHEPTKQEEKTRNNNNQSTHRSQ